MANLLRDLVVEEVSLVDAPACSQEVNGRKVPRARIALYKRDTSDDLKSKVLKYIYPAAARPVARSFEQVYSDFERMEEFKEMDEEFREKVSALTEAVNSIVGDPSVRDKQSEINRAVDQFVASVKQGLSEEEEPYHKFGKAAGVKFIIGFPKEGGSQVQSVLFDKDKWTEATAKKWLSDHDFGSSKVDETADNYRYRQADPEKFVRFRTITPGSASKHDGEWDDKDALCKAVEGKTEDGQVFPKGDYAYTPSDNVSEWKLRLTSTPGGKPDPHIVGAAVAALGKGFRGRKVQIPASARNAVKARVRAAWRSANPDKGEEELPPVLKVDKGEEERMTLEQIEKKVSEQDGLLATLKADNDALTAERELILKMGKKERKAYAAMTPEMRKEYMAADATKRSAMLRRKGLEDSMDEATCKRYRAAGAVEQAVILDEVEKAGKKKGKNGADGEFEPDEDDLEEEEKARKALVAKLAASEDRLSTAEARLMEIRKRERLVQFTKMAESALPHTAGTPEDKGRTLMSLADGLGGEESEPFKKVLGDLKAADAAIAKGFTEVGKVGGDIPILKVWDAKVEEISKRDKLDAAHATMKAMEECPEIYLEYEHQQRQLVRGL